MEQCRDRGWTEMRVGGCASPAPTGGVTVVRSERDRGLPMPGRTERTLAPGAEHDGEDSFQSPLERWLPAPLAPLHTQRHRTLISRSIVNSLKV